MMTGVERGLPEKKRVAYLWGGVGLLILAAVTTGLNVGLQIPDYQKVSWFLIGFFGFSGISGVAAAKGAIPPTGKIVEYGEALIVAGLLAMTIRGCAVQAFKIPSGSMLPTLLIGDHLLVSKFLYGIRIPYTEDRVFRLREPRRGDIVVFAFPQDDSKDFIKRVIGEPGDRIEVRDKRVCVNGKAIEDPWGVIEQPGRRVHMNGEMISDPWGAFAGDPADGRRGQQGANMPPVEVPEGHYFVMGDNRDRSLDSRFWGFVADARIRGKAFIIYWSWDAAHLRPRFGRIGNLIH